MVENRILDVFLLFAGSVPHSSIQHLLASWAEIKVARLCGRNILFQRYEVTPEVQNKCACADLSEDSVYVSYLVSVCMRKAEEGELIFIYFPDKKNVRKNTHL